MMNMMISRSLVVAFAVVAVCFILVAPFHAHAAPTDAECRNAWEASSASNSCGKKDYFEGQAYVDTGRYDVSAQNNQCRARVDCYKANRDIVADSFSPDRTIK